MNSVTRLSKRSLNYIANRSSTARQVIHTDTQYLYILQYDNGKAKDLVLDYLLYTIYGAHRKCMIYSIQKKNKNKKQHI